MSLQPTIHLLNGGNTRVTVDAGKRLKVLDTYVDMSFHDYTGPYFETADGNEYEPPTKKAERVMWAAFGRWLDRYRAAQERREKLGQSNYRVVRHF